jgi:hypothetical protein
MDEEISAREQPTREAWIAHHASRHETSALARLIFFAELAKAGPTHGMARQSVRTARRRIAARSA